MTKQRRTFTAEFKREASSLVLDQGSLKIRFALKPLRGLRSCSTKAQASEKRLISDALIDHAPANEPIGCDRFRCVRRPQLSVTPASTI